jgi:hypothetical protein
MRGTKARKRGVRRVKVEFQTEGTQTLRDVIERSDAIREAMVSKGSWTPSSGPEQSPSPTLAEWWRQLAEREIERNAPKVDEYGATDLAVMGRALVALLPPAMQTEAVGMEMACAFYALGKIGRIVSSYAAGKLPKEDSWHDMGVYARMAQRIRETGRWP